MIYQSKRMQRLLAVLRKYCAVYRGNQATAALACGCSPSTVSDWLHGRKNPTGEQVLSILSFLDNRPRATKIRRRGRKGPPKNVTPP